jgi:uncharacterized protein (TIGR03118 family)
MYWKAVFRLWLACALAALFASTVKAQAYQQTNLVSDIQGLAQNPPSGDPDPQLLNPWGLVASTTSPWWISDNNAGVSTLYNGQGVKQSLVVNIPSPVSGTPGTPTGVVFTGTSGFTFTENNTTVTATFTFVTEDGTIVAWGPGANPSDLRNDAFIVVDNSQNPSAQDGAVYKGATIAQMAPNGPFFLYVANIRSGRIEVYDSSFKPASPTADRGGFAFVDPFIPPGFAAFNVQAINGNLYVTYAKQDASRHDDFDFPGFGFVDVFSPTGRLLQRLQPGPWLNAPWGVVLTPANFGFYSNHVLVGNAGSGQIAVYDLNGRFVDLLRDSNGHAIQNDRLWGLAFGNGQGSGPADWLYFTAGIADEAHGLFGFLTPASTSSTPSTTSAPGGN